MSRATRATRPTQAASCLNLYSLSYETDDRQNIIYNLSAFIYVLRWWRHKRQVIKANADVLITVQFSDPAEGLWWRQSLLFLCHKTLFNLSQWDVRLLRGQEVNWGQCIVNASVVRGCSSSCSLFLPRRNHSAHVDHRRKKSEERRQRFLCHELYFR